MGCGFRFLLMQIHIYSVSCNATKIINIYREGNGFINRRIIRRLPLQYLIKYIHRERYCRQIRKILDNPLDKVSLANL